MSKQKKKQNNIHVKSDVKKKKKRKTVPGCVTKTTDRVKILLTSPDSSLTEINIKTFVNEETLQKLPSYLQYKLMALLPNCDQHVHSDGSLKLSDEAFTNEFFTKACEEWRGKLAEGCFTEDRLQHMNIERSRQQATDAWKIKYFESTVPPEPVENCPSNSPAQSTSTLHQKLRKRRLDVVEEITNPRNSCRKRVKMNLDVSKSDGLNGIGEKKMKEEQDATNWKNGSSSKERQSKVKKSTVVKKLTKTSGIKKTRLLRNRTPKAIKKINQSLTEIKICTKSKIDKKVDDVHENSHNGLSIKSKILNHLNNKLGKCDRQLPMEANKEVVTSGEPQQFPSNSGSGTLTLSDLISREFELICNSNAKETTPTTLKFEHLKVGFVSHKMFQSPVSSKVSSSVSTLPHFWKLADSQDDFKLLCKPKKLNQHHSVTTSQSIQSNSDKDFKHFYPISPVTKEDRPLAEYFPLLSNSLKNSSKPVEPTIAQFKVSMTASRRNSNSVERETLLCLANKLSQKLFNKINLSTSLPMGENSHAAANSDASETLQTGPSSMELSKNLDPKANSGLKYPVTKQNTSANINLLNILLSVSTKSSFPISSHSLNASMSAGCRTTSVINASQISHFSRFPHTSSSASLIKAGTSIEIIDDNKAGEKRHLSASPCKSGSRSSSSNESVTEDFNQPSLKPASSVSWHSSDKLIPSTRCNDSVEQSKCSNKLLIHSNSDLLGFLPKTSSPQKRNTFKPSLTLQTKDLAEDSRISLQTVIPLNKPLQNICVASSRVHPSPFRSSTLQNFPSAPTNNASNPGRTSINYPLDCNPSNAVLHSRLILNEKGLGRKPQNVASQTSSSQFPLVQGDKLVNFQLNTPSSNLYFNNVSFSNNISNGNDKMKTGNMSFQLPMTSLVPSLRLQAPPPHCNQISSFQAPNNLSMTNSSSPLIIFSPLNQPQLNLGSYMTVNNMASDGILNISCKKAEIPSNNIFQMNQVVVSPPNYLPLLNVPQGSVVPQISPTMSKSQIVLLQNPPSASPMSSRSFALPSDLSNNNGLKNVTFIPVVNTSTNNNQMFFLLSPKASNQK